MRNLFNYETYEQDLIECHKRLQEIEINHNIENATYNGTLFDIYKELNLNKLGFENINGTCASFTICEIFNRNNLGMFRPVIEEYSNIPFEIEYENIDGTISTRKTYIQKLGFDEYGLCVNGKKYFNGCSLAQFIKKHKKGSYALSISYYGGLHSIAIIDGVIYSNGAEYKTIEEWKIRNFYSRKTNKVWGYSTFEYLLKYKDKIIETNAILKY